MKEDINTIFQYQHFHKLKKEKQTNQKKVRWGKKEDLFCPKFSIEMFSGVDSQTSQATVIEHRFIKPSLNVWASETEFTSFLSVDQSSH